MTQFPQLPQLPPLPPIDPFDRTWQVRIGIGAAALLGAWFLFVALPSWYTDVPEEPSEQTVDQPAGEPRADGSTNTIKATVFHGSQDGMRLVGLDREVPFESDPVEQARRIVEAQLEPATSPYVSVVPAGTTLRALYVTDRGDAFVDLSREVSSAHPGGSLSELYTVYAIVNALTVNLPAVSGVQILVEGHEVDTLAGHVDLRHPLRKSMKWVGEPSVQSARRQTDP